MWTDGVLVVREAVHTSAVEEFHPTSEWMTLYRFCGYLASLVPGMPLAYINYFMSVYPGFGIHGLELITNLINIDSIKQILYYLTAFNSCCQWPELKLSPIISSGIIVAQQWPFANGWYPCPLIMSSSMVQVIDPSTRESPYTTCKWSPDVLYIRSEWPWIAHSDLLLHMHTTNYSIALNSSQTRSYVKQ